MVQCCLLGSRKAQVLPEAAPLIRTEPDKTKGQCDGMHKDLYLSVWKELANEEGMKSNTTMINMNISYIFSELVIKSLIVHFSHLDNYLLFSFYHLSFYIFFLAPAASWRTTFLVECNKQF
ncbi:hypothetical protein Hdeb2414_s0009g00324171 [Helianthus debilis subsp. tardiflorus]